jgi:uroporphyrinogen-III synthase
MLEPAPLDFDRRRVRALTDAARTLVFYSPNSVEILAESGALAGLNLSQKIAWAVGERTAAALAECFGFNARFPDDQQFRGLLDEFHKTPPKQPLIAFGLEGSPRSLIGAAPGQFAAASAGDVHEISVYQTTPKRHPDLGGLLSTEDVAWIAFTSPRGVAALVSQVALDDLRGLRIAAIGPTTAAALRRLGLKVDLVMDTPDRNLMMKIIAAGPP